MFFHREPDETRADAGVVFDLHAVVRSPHLGQIRDKSTKAAWLLQDPEVGTQISRCIGLSPRRSPGGGRRANPQTS